MRDAWPERRQGPPGMWPSGREMQSVLGATFRSRSNVGRDAPIGRGATNSRSALAPLRPSRPSDPQLLPDQAVDLAAVGAALGLLHHGADDRADRLAVAGADLLGGFRVGLDCRRDDRLQLAAVRGHLGEALALDDRGRVAALGDQGRENGLAAAVGD